MPRLTVGVMGTASKAIDARAALRMHHLGRRIAECGCVLITGACPGMPQAAVEGARSVGGLVVGISPALSQSEHVRRYGSPIDGFDVIIYNGSGLMGREIDSIRSSDMVVIAGGRSGTLGEFAIAYDEGHLIGILEGTGGIADHASQLVEMFGHKETGAQILYDDDPIGLIDRLLVEHQRRAAGGIG